MNHEFRMSQAISNAGIGLDVDCGKSAHWKNGTFTEIQPVSGIHEINTNVVDLPRDVLRQISRPFQRLPALESIEVIPRPCQLLRCL